MMIFGIVLVLSVTLLRNIVVASFESEYEAQCIVKSGSVACMAALFTKEGPFAMSGSLALAPHAMCDPNANLTVLKSELVAVWRGECSFEAKVIAAMNSGFNGLVIINTDNDGTIFPVGNANPVIPMHGQTPSLLIFTSTPPYIIYFTF